MSLNPTHIRLGNGWLAWMDNTSEKAIYIQDSGLEPLEPQYAHLGQGLTFSPEMQKAYINTKDKWAPPNRWYFNPEFSRPELITQPKHPSGLDPADFSGDDLLDRIIRWMLTNDNEAQKYLPHYLPCYEIFTEPGAVNIIYVRSCSYDCKYQEPRNNAWDDLRLVFQFVGGVPKITFSQQATVDPGTYWVEGRKGNPRGTAMICFGQYEAWCHGIHRDDEALVQCNSLALNRDYNCNYRRDEKVSVERGNGINQHHGGNSDYFSVGMYSAGCIVGRDVQKHREFMKKIKEDPGYKKNRHFVYNTTILDGNDLFFKNDPVAI